LTHILQDRLVYAQISDQPLQLGILVLELLQPAYLHDAHRAELLLSSVERLLRHADLATDLRDRLAGRLLRKRLDDLLFRETPLLFLANLHTGWRPKCPR